MHESESEVTRSCPTLSDYMDCSLPGSSVHGIFQASILEWVAIAFSSELPELIKHSLLSVLPCWLLAVFLHVMWTTQFIPLRKPAPLLHLYGWKPCPSFYV
ncbi:unnamed protein product [Rangifer tarandus platyrhynchus]|uniref:Uncharacterized protein n=1 Tax=Rangifer tarandus platyrhynchus TaxID=3082113 RepID=A0AC59ZK65_RANTA